MMMIVNQGYLKQNKSEEIITVSERLFINMGFENSTMDEIAKQAHYTKRTVYKYFRSKEDLYFAVVFKWLRKLMAYFDQAAMNGNSGLECIHLAGSAYQNFFNEYPEIIRLMNHSQFIKPDGPSENYEQSIILGRDMFNKFAQFIKKGKLDGSIKESFNEVPGVFVIYFLITGFFFRLSEAGQDYSNVYGIDPDNLGSIAINLLIDSIRKK